MYKHPCVKCSTVYEDNDPDAYFCEPCKEERKKIAQRVDQIRSSLPKKPRTSLLQEYDSQPKVRGFIQIKF